MEKETLFHKYKRFDKAVKQNISENISLMQKLYLFLDFIIEYKFYGTHLLDYIQYEFYTKRKVERRKYVVHGKLLELIHTCNDAENRHFFDRKTDFDRVFSDYLQREWLDAGAADFKEFEKFLKNKEDFFVKQPDGMFGTGVEKVYIKDIQSKEKFFENLKKKKALCEETLTQCKEMKEFNDTSINTLRVVSLVQANGKVKIMGGLLRVGRKGKIADNFHHQGICAFIEPSTGIVSTTGVDKNNKRYVIHPDSGKKIVGFEVPIWNEIVKIVKQAALVVPNMRYVGWDVVITEDYKVALVEGNSGADPDAEQITTKEGRWPYYEMYLREIRKLRK